jgi:uncharacterized membrane protein
MTRLPTFDGRSSTTILWLLVVAYVADVIIGAVVQAHVALVLQTVLLLAFVLLHGAGRYGWRGIAAFSVVTLGVGNILENLSIVTGFPFGYYSYTVALGPRLLLVPITVGLSYVSFGYISWTLTTLFVGKVNRFSGSRTLVAVPLGASLIMVAWDLALDPIASTINHDWVWTQGGGYFGVPFSNFLGWFLTAFIFFQLFALYLKRSKPKTTEVHLARARTTFLQPSFVYLGTGLSFVVQYFAFGNTRVIDATGHVWQTGDIYLASAVIAIFAMILLAVMALLKITRLSSGEA